MSDIALFIGGASVGLLTWLTILLFKSLIKRSRQIRRSVFVATVTALMMVFGLVI